jgi:hypothetical protein
VHILGSQLRDSANDNVDVQVEFANGQRFGATFFTLSNIETLFEKNRKSGECAGGLYLWASNMILVRDLSTATIERAVDDLVACDEFRSAFAQLDRGAGLRG